MQRTRRVRAGVLIGALVAAGLSLGVTNASAQDDGSQGSTSATPDDRCTNQFDYATDPRSNAEINSLGATNGECPPVLGSSDQSPKVSDGDPTNETDAGTDEAVPQGAVDAGNTAAADGPLRGLLVVGVAGAGAAAAYGARVYVRR